MQKHDCTVHTMRKQDSTAAFAAGCSSAAVNHYNLYNGLNKKTESELSTTH